MRNTLRKPVADDLRGAIELYGTELRTGPHGPSTRITVTQDFNGAGFGERVEHLDGSVLRFATSQELGSLGVFGKALALLNDFAGGDLVTTDQLAMLRLTPATATLDFNELVVDFKGGIADAQDFPNFFRFSGVEDRRFVESDFPLSANSHSVFGSFSSAFFQGAEGVGPFARELVGIVPDVSGAIDIFLVGVTFNNEADRARFNDVVAPALGQLGAQSFDPTNGLFRRPFGPGGV